MVVSNIVLTESFCLTLSLICVIQLLLTGIPTFMFSEILILTKSHLSTLVGLIAGFISLPSAIRLKATHISPDVDKIYGYTLCYQRLAMGISALLNFIALIFAIVALTAGSKLQKDFKYLMKHYYSKPSAKSLIDDIQYNLQCCGAKSYNDWFKINEESTNQNIRTREVNLELLREDIDSDDPAMMRYDMVPFSCCSKMSTLPCINQNLIQLGASTINSCGCGNKLWRSIKAMIWVHLILYFICFSLEVLIAVILLLKELPSICDSKCLSKCSESWPISMKSTTDETIHTKKSSKRTQFK